MSVMPAVAEENCFALKGGTAINLFIRDLPRLSVDLDLTYLPIADRAQSLTEIDESLKRIGVRVTSALPHLTVQESTPSTQKTINKLVIRTPQRLQIKIEVTPVLRGCVYEPQLMAVSEKTEDEFGFARMNVLSFADIYAGKVMAALDRQHPRDLFDIHHLFENEGLTDKLRTALIIYLISHDHSPHSLLSPTPRDIRQIFETDFVGMTERETSLEILLSTRTRLIEEVKVGMTENQKLFLISFYKGDPEWIRLGIPGLDQLPAVRWRELNLKNAGPGTREEIIKSLEEVFSA
jgi:predicted nucleotidyltransferase component of viral defense system